MQDRIPLPSLMRRQGEPRTFYRSDHQGDENRQRCADQRSPRSELLAVGLGLLLLLAAGNLEARDFPKPIAAANPFALGQEEAGILPGGVSDFGYHTYAFVNGDHDLFSLRQRTAVALFANSRMALAGYYDSYLMVGPVRPAEDPFSIADWNMNSVQFEYGLVAAGRFGRIDVAVEYGRTSQHPLRYGYSEVSSDIVELSAYIAPTLPLGVTLNAGLRTAYIDLFQFWNSPLLAPRTQFRFELPIVVSVPIGGISHAIARLSPRLLVVRTAGAWHYADAEPRLQMEIDAEVGLRVARESALELVLELYSTADSEQLRGEAAPLTTLGVGVRMATD